VLADLSVKEFLEKTASSSPFPGGGSVAAFGAALGASLAEMVANLTIGKKGYESAADEMRIIAAKASDLRKKLTENIDRDSASYEQVMKAFALPKNTEEQKLLRAEAVQNALKNAALIPLDVAESGVQVMELAEKAILLGNKNAVTDGLVGMLMLRSAVLGAIRNVKINLESIQDRDFCQKLSAQVNDLQKQVTDKETAVLGIIF